MALARLPAAGLDSVICSQNTIKQPPIPIFRSPISNVHRFFMDFHWFPRLQPPNCPGHHKTAPDTLVPGLQCKVFVVFSSILIDFQVSSLQVASAGDAKRKQFLDLWDDIWWIPSSHGPAFWWCSQFLDLSLVTFEKLPQCDIGQKCFGEVKVSKLRFQHFWKISWDGILIFERYHGMVWKNIWKISWDG